MEAFSITTLSLMYINYKGMTLHAPASIFGSDINTNSIDRG